MQNQSVIPEILTVAEVAELLAVTPRTIQNWVQARKIPYVRIGGRPRLGRGGSIRFIRSEIDQWLLNNRIVAVRNPEDDGVQPIPPPPKKMRKKGRKISFFS